MSKKADNKPVDKSVQSVDDTSAEAVQTVRKAVSRKDMTLAQWTWKEMKRNKTAYLMIAPFLMIFILFTVFPVVLSLVISFTSFNMTTLPEFIFMDNYIRLFLDDDLFVTAIKNTLIFACITGPVSYILSFLVAWFINELDPRVRAIVTLIFYAPSISGNVYLIWQYLFSGDAYGLVNATMMEMGFITEPILWFKDAKYVMGLCIVVSLWTSLGTAFLSFIAGLQTIDRSLFEAAAVDGIKNRWQELWYVTLPTMRPQLMFGAVMSITGAFNFGPIVTALAGNPSVDYAAYTIMQHLEEYSGVRWEVGYASAISFFLFLVMILANMAVNKMLAKVGE